MIESLNGVASQREVGIHRKAILPNTVVGKIEELGMLGDQKNKVFEDLLLGRSFFEEAGLKGCLTQFVSENFPSLEGKLKNAALDPYFRVSSGVSRELGRVFVTANVLDFNVPIEKKGDTGYHFSVGVIGVSRVWGFTRVHEGSNAVRRFNSESAMFDSAVSVEGLTAGSNGIVISDKVKKQAQSIVMTGLKGGVISIQDASFLYLPDVVYANAENVSKIVA